MSLRAYMVKYKYSHLKEKVYAFNIHKQKNKQKKKLYDVTNIILDIKMYN